jgi:hypothetical protein
MMRGGLVVSGGLVIHGKSRHRGSGEISSDGSSARHEVEDEHDNGEDQKNVNPAAHRVAADESYDPEDEENNCDCPKHDSIS